MYSCDRWRVLNYYVTMIPGVRQNKPIFTSNIRLVVIKEN